MDRMQFGSNGEILPILMQKGDSLAHPINLALELEKKGLFKNSSAINFRITAHRRFVNIDLFANKNLRWKTKPVCLVSSISGLPSSWACGVTEEGVQIKSGEIDLDCL